MQEDGLEARARKRFKCTTMSDHDQPVAANLLDRCFEAPGPNQRWVGDTTEFVIGSSGKLYLAVVLDLFSRFVVGWAVSAVNDRHVTIKALDMALKRRCPDAGLLHHSDQGCTYASEDYQTILGARGIVCSMSRRGNCYDNAVMESFFSTVKSELADRFDSFGEAKMELFDYLEVFYNQRRRHSTLGQQSGRLRTASCSSGVTKPSTESDQAHSVYVEGLSERAAARRFGLARETVRKMLRSRRPPGYRRAQPVRRPKLDAFTGIIDQILREDQSRPKKQRHTAKRIGERLRAEYGFTGGDTIVKAYVRAQRLGGQEMFVPLAHPPGDAQADFGEALVVIAGVDCKAHDLVVDLPHSDDGFVQAFPAETTEAFCDGHNAAFGYFGGVPRRIVYDNTKLAVARILGDGTRQRTQVFCERQSHYLFADRFGRPGKGNDNGKVEGLVGYVRRNFFVPIPRFASWDALNADFAHKCGERRGRR